MNPYQAAQPSARILIIDDQETCALSLGRMMQRAGYAICITITDATIAVERFEELAPDLVLLDLHMAPLSGVDVLKAIEEKMPPQRRPPVLIMTGDTTPEAKHEALAAGATDFLSKPFDEIEVLLRVRHMLEARSLHERCQVYSRRLEELAATCAAVLQEQAEGLERGLAELRKSVIGGSAG
jgi:DNA-binding response OmpR family regulator